MSGRRISAAGYIPAFGTNMQPTREKIEKINEKGRNLQIMLHSFSNKGYIPEHDKLSFLNGLLSLQGCAGEFIDPINNDCGNNINLLRKMLEYQCDLRRNTVFYLETLEGNVRLVYTLVPKNEKKAALRQISEITDDLLE